MTTNVAMAPCRATSIKADNNWAVETVLGGAVVGWEGDEVMAKRAGRNRPKIILDRSID